MCAFESSNKPEEMNNEWTQDCADVSAAVFHVFAQGHRPFTITSTSCANFTSAYIKLPSALAANVFTLSVKGWCHLIVFLFFFHHTVFLYHISHLSLILFISTYSYHLWPPASSLLSVFHSPLFSIGSSNWAALYFEVLRNLSV